MSVADENNAADDPIGEPNDPGITKVYNHMLFGLSLPERTLRSTSAMVGGVLRESTELLVPQAFRNSKSYGIFVKQAIDFMAENIGGVESENDGSEEMSATQVEGYVARKAVGNFVELAGLATLHISPITVLAVLSDVAYGSTFYLKELSEELKKEGVISSDSTIDSASDLLDAVSNASGVTASAFDMPPLSVEGLRQTIDQTRDAVKKIDPTKLLPQKEIGRIWGEMRDVADKEKVGLFDVSSAMTLFTLNRIGTAGKGALSTVRVAGNLFDRHIIDHYTDGIADIRKKGLYASLSESSEPYIKAVWQNFSNDKSTITEDLFNGKLIGKAWQGMGKWFSKEAVEAGKPDLDSQDPSSAEGAEDDPRQETSADETSPDEPTQTHDAKD